MTTNDPRAPVAPGEPAPDFTLPAVDGKEPVSLADYRGKSPVFLGLLIGLWCPFCRRQIAKMGANEAKLKALGVETLGVVATEPENAQLYFKFRATRLRLGADPELTTHRLYGLPKPAATAEFMKAFETTRVNPFGEFPEPVPLPQTPELSAKLDGFVGTETDQSDMMRQFPQLKGQFLIDRDGIVRWANIECAREGIAGIGKFPSDQEILGAARTLLRS
jgi:peroxiredoxin